MNKNIQNIPEDIFLHIKNFLDNKTIINLLCTNSNIKKMIGNKNIFTSLLVKYNEDLLDNIKKFINHKNSIKTTILYRLDSPHIFWPFDTRIMIFIDCGNKDEIYENYKDNKIIKKLILTEDIHYLSNWSYYLQNL
jgi:hypothetical protein